jgi:hypothetical protein
MKEINGARQMKSGQRVCQTPERSKDTKFVKKKYLDFPHIIKLYLRQLFQNASKHMVGQRAAKNHARHNNQGFGSK